MMRGLMPGWGMGNQMDHAFDRMAEARGDDVLAVGDWAPSLDISETKDSLVAKVEVPGMERKDIQISLQENLLTIKGEKRCERDDNEERYLRVERAYGLFLRSIRLPVAVDRSKVTAAFKNGLLTVTLPKTSAAKGTMIPIKAE